MHTHSVHAENNKGSALVLSMMMMVVMIIMAIYLLDKIIPFSKSTKDIENGNIAYYRANTALNKALLNMSGSVPETELNETTVANGSGMSWGVNAVGMDLPRAGQGTSEYDRNWSMLAPGKPIQLVLPANGGIDWTTSAFTFRVPDLDGDGDITNQVLTGSTLVINWILTSPTETLLSSGSQIMQAQINGSTPVYLGGRNGVMLTGSGKSFMDFYGDKCATVRCILKMSIVATLSINNSNIVAPYLEYQIKTDRQIPLQTATVSTQGFAGGYRQNIVKYVQQLTTNEALDFTVFQ